VRFEVSRVLDTIEERLTTDATLAAAVVDLGEVARFVELDGGRGINLLRIGMVIDALGRYLRDGGALVYAVAARSLLGESELTSKERMVLGRWADDGLIEVTPQLGDRVIEVADLAGLAVIGRRDPAAAADRYPWLRDVPHRALTLSPRGGGALLTDGRGGIGGATADGRAGADGADRGAGHPDLEQATGGQPAGEPHPFRAAARAASGSPVPAPVPSGIGSALLVRSWRCREFSCPAFGEGRRIGQPVPRMRAGVPTCPRHDKPLQDVGPRTPQIALSVVVEGMGRRLFVVVPGRPVIVGRSPDDPQDIQIGQWLDEAASAWISRSHLRFDLRDGALTVTDLSTNGTTVLLRAGPQAPPERIRLAHGEPRRLGEWDTVELYTEVEVIRPARRLTAATVAFEPSSVLADAPTVAMRLPGYAS
jgi:hypothetical protein